MLKCFSYPIRIYTKVLPSDTRIEVQTWSNALKTNHGKTTYENCYFLTSEVLAGYGGSVETYLNAIQDAQAAEIQNGRKSWEPKTDLGTESSNSEVTPLTYEQLAGMQAGIPGKDPALDIYGLLPGFSPVTTVTEDGIRVPGKYSYPPATSPQLRDRDYPFPTILRKDGGKYNVHYGDWPLKGFRRQTLFDENGKYALLGGSPIEIDLFVNGTAPHQESPSGPPTRRAIPWTSGCKTAN